MAAPAPRSYTGLAIAVVVAALIVGASIYAAFSGVSTTTVTDTKTPPTTTTTSTTVCLCPTAPAPCPCVSSQEESTTSTYGGGGPTVTTIASTGDSFATTTASTTSDSNHLQLNLGIKSNGGANITISAEESNLLDSVNNVTGANNFSFNNWSSPAFGPFPCGNSVHTVGGGGFEASVQFPIEVAVLEGNYGVDNYTSGTALTTYDTGQVYTCPGIDDYVQYLVFGPDGGNASFYYGSSLIGSYLVSDQLTTSGYWTGEQSTAVFHPFPPGSYTVLAEDEWGDVVFLHFDVVVTTVTETMNSTIHSTNTIDNSSSSSPTCTAAATSLTLCHTMSTTCTISAEGSGFYVTVLSDSGQSIQGVPVSGTLVTEVGSSTCTQNIGTYFTNSTGSVLITPNIGSYYLLSITYQGNNYSVKAPIEPMMTTYVTLRVPSGNTTISEVFEGGCQTSPQGVSCPG